MPKEHPQAESLAQGCLQREGGSPAASDLRESVLVSNQPAHGPSTKQFAISDCRVPMGRSIGNPSAQDKSEIGLWDVFKAYSLGNLFYPPTQADGLG